MKVIRLISFCLGFSITFFGNNAEAHLACVTKEYPSESHPSVGYVRKCRKYEYSVRRSEFVDLLCSLSAPFKVNNKRHGRLFVIANGLPIKRIKVTLPDQEETFEIEKFDDYISKYCFADVLQDPDRPGYLNDIDGEDNLIDSGSVGTKSQ